MICKTLKLTASNSILRDWVPVKYMKRFLNASSADLEPIGIFEPTLEDKQYVTGQLFLHKVFGYRGIILTPWELKMYDRDEITSRTFKKNTKSLDYSVCKSNEETSTTSTDFHDGKVTKDGVFDRKQSSHYSSSPSSSPAAAGEGSGSGSESNKSSDEKVFSFSNRSNSSTDQSVSSYGQTKTENTSTPSSQNQSQKSVPQSRKCLYYSVLMDERDWRHVQYRTQTEGVSFLHDSNEDSNRPGGGGGGSSSIQAWPFFTIPGLDYVSHDDVMPYSSLSVKPIQHNLLDKFISYEPTNEPPFVASQALKQWTSRNKFWLEPTDVYKETTNDIRVTVVPFYMGCKRIKDTNKSSLALNNAAGLVQQYWWRYCIRLENVGTQNVQLCERNWRIFSMNGSLETVRARGVNGVEPLLSMDMPAFQYSSHVSLYTPSGHMWGTFRIRSRSGKAFDVKVPPFTLECKSAIKDHSDGVDGGPHSG